MSQISDTSLMLIKEFCIFIDLCRLILDMIIYVKFKKQKGLTQKY